MVTAKKGCSTRAVILAGGGGGEWTGHRSNTALQLLCICSLAFEGLTLTCYVSE